MKSPLVEPPRSPFATTVAGAGIIEARSDASNTANISVGSELSGVVSIVGVKVGAKVKAGDLLFELDDRQMRAELAYREANLAASKRTGSAATDAAAGGSAAERSQAP